MPIIINMITLLISFLMILLSIYLNIFPIRYFFIYGIITIIPLYYNLYIYINLERLSGNLEKKYLTKYTIPLLSGLYLGFVGVLSARFVETHGKYNYGDVALIIGGLSFIFGIIGFLFFAVSLKKFLHKSL